MGNLAGCYSRRINIQHRLVFEVLPDENVVHVLRMWTHDEQQIAFAVRQDAKDATPSASGSPSR